MILLAILRRSERAFGARICILHQCNLLACIAVTAAPSSQWHFLFPWHALACLTGAPRPNSSYGWRVAPLNYSHYRTMVIFSNNEDTFAVRAQRWPPGTQPPPSGGFRVQRLRGRGWCTAGGAGVTRACHPTKYPNAPLAMEREQHAPFCRRRSTVDGHRERADRATITLHALIERRSTDRGGAEVGGGGPSVARTGGNVD